MENIKVIISEIDGVVTEDMQPIDELVNTPFKIYYMKDFEVVNELKRHFKFVFVAADPSVNYNLCRKKSIPFYNRDTKLQAVKEIMTRYSVTPDEVVYVGCKFSDIECMQLVPRSFCPDDSPSEIKNLASTILPTYGGGGVLCALYDIMKPEINRRLRLDK